MASFDPEETERNNENKGSEMIKYPIRRLELSIRKFVKVLDIDIDRLYKHTVNITRLTTAEDWQGLHREQVNASRTIQQIKANIREIEKTRDQVTDADLSQFDSKVQGVKIKALSAMQEFMQFAGMQPSTVSQPNNDVSESTAGESSVITGRGDVKLPQKNKSHTDIQNPLKQSQTASKPSLTPALSQDLDENDGTNMTSPYGSLPAMLTMPGMSPDTQLHIVPNDCDASASWEQLQENIVELNELVHTFAEEVEQQGETIDSMEENLEVAHHNVREGTQHLAKASKYKTALFPVIGAVVGGVVGGPIGLAAGIKIGGLAGAMGVGAGFVGGRYIKKHQENIAEVEMSNLSEKHTVTASDLGEMEQSKKTQLPASTPKKEEKEKESEEKTDDADTDVFATVTSSFKKFFSMSED